MTNTYSAGTWSPKLKNLENLQSALLVRPSSDMSEEVPTELIPSIILFRITQVQGGTTLGHISHQAGHSSGLPIAGVPRGITETHVNWITYI